MQFPKTTKVPPSAVDLRDLSPCPPRTIPTALDSKVRGRAAGQPRAIDPLRSTLAASLKPLDTSHLSPAQPASQGRARTATKIEAIQLPPRCFCLPGPIPGDRTG